MMQRAFLYRGQFLVALRHIQNICGKQRFTKDKPDKIVPPQLIDQRG